MTRPAGRVVLLGGGYVTLHAYGALMRRVGRAVRRGDVELVVVSADTAHSFHGFTGEVLAGRLPVELTRTPLAGAMPHARVVHGRVEHVDPGRRVVTYRPPGQAEPDTLPYDALVVGTGAHEPVDAVPGLADHGLTLRRPGDLRTLVDRTAVAAADARPVVVVGGGLAGVELAAALAGRVGLAPSVVLVHHGDRLVPALADAQPRLAARCTAELARLRVDVRTGTSVVAADADGVVLSDGSSLPAALVLATVGQRPVPLAGLDGLARDERGRLRTTRDLAVVGADAIWSAGDAAAVAHPRTGAPVPANALWAIKAGDHVGRSVARALRGRPGRPFRYLGLGQAAAFGPGHGVAELYGVPILGRAAWLLRLVFFLRFMPSRSRALRVPLALARAGTPGAAAPVPQRVPVATA